MPRSKVLVVEDDDDIRRLLAEYLAEHSHVEVEPARDAIEALHQLSTHSYSVIVLDIMMPKMSGVDLLTSLQALRDDPSVRTLESMPAVLIITSVSNGEVSDTTLKERFPGVVRGVFRKPLELNALAEEVERYCQRVR
jgi:CheY-like chemotaxis protein